MRNTELHKHLDVSLRLETLLELAQERWHEAQSTSLEEFRKKIVLTEPLSDLNSVLATFSLFPKVLDRPEVLERVAFEVVEDAYNEGTRQIELRFSLSFVTEHSGLSWDDALLGFELGLKKAIARYPEMKAGLICIASRDFGVDAVMKTAEFYLKHQDRFIAMDLAGNEKGYPCSLFTEPFKKIKAQGGKITIHAGEDSGPDNIWEAIEILGARRIGHGLSSIQDPELIKHLIEKQICLEMCPTSNWLTRAVVDLKDHPLPKLLRMGVPVCINTDDPTVFGVNLTHEIKICRTKMGMTDDEIAQCQKHALNASFLLQ